MKDRYWWQTKGYGPSLRALRVEGRTLGHDGAGMCKHTSDLNVWDDTSGNKKYCSAIRAPRPTDRNLEHEGTCVREHACDLSAWDDAVATLI